MKKYGIVLPTWVYNQERVSLAKPAFETLASTVHDENKPKLLMLYKAGFLDMLQIFDMLSINFDLGVVNDPSDVKGTEQTLAWGTEILFNGDSKCDYVTWMGDDALFHPQWHMKLRKLIEDKPDAMGWSVYRSAYEQFHQTLRVEGDYVNVSTLCGHGMTISKEECKAWGVKWEDGYWPSPYGDTLDLHHAWVRSTPERWTTKVSYVAHTGLDGLHCKPWIPEHAVDFQGVE